MVAQYIPVARLDQKLKELDEEERRLRARLLAIPTERSFIQSLRREAVDVATADLFDEAAEGEEPQPGTKGGTWKEQIVAFVRQNPGLNSSAIASHLEAQGVCNNSMRPRKTIQTLLGQLLTAHRVSRDEMGRYTAV